MRNMFLAGMLLLCLWSCGTSSETVRDEPSEQFAVLNQDSVTGLLTQLVSDGDSKDTSSGLPKFGESKTTGLPNVDYIDLRQNTVQLGMIGDVAELTAWGIGIAIFITTIGAGIASAKAI